MKEEILPVHKVETCYGFSRGTVDPACCHKDLHRGVCNSKERISIQWSLTSVCNLNNRPQLFKEWKRYPQNKSLSGG